MRARDKSAKLIAVLYFLFTAKRSNLYQKTSRHALNGNNNMLSSMPLSCLSIWELNSFPSVCSSNTEQADDKIATNRNITNSNEQSTRIILTFFK